MFPLFAVQTSIVPTRRYKVLAERLNHKIVAQKDFPANADLFCAQLQTKQAAKRDPMWHAHSTEEKLCLDDIFTERTTEQVIEFVPFSCPTSSNVSHLMPQIPNREIMCMECVDWIEPVAHFDFLLEHVQVYPLKGPPNEGCLGDLDDILLVHRPSPTISLEDWSYDLVRVADLQPPHRFLCTQEQLMPMPPLLSLESVTCTTHVFAFSDTMLRELTVKPFPHHSPTVQSIRSDEETGSREPHCLEETTLPVCVMSSQRVQEAHWREIFAISFEDCSKSAFGEHLTPSLSPASHCQESLHAPRKKRLFAVDWLSDGAKHEPKMLPFPARPLPASISSTTSTGQVSAVERLLDLQSPWTFMPIHQDRRGILCSTDPLKMLDLPQLQEYAPLLPKPMARRSKRLLSAHAVDLAETVAQILEGGATSEPVCSASRTGDGIGATAMEQFALTAALPAVVEVGNVDNPPAQSGVSNLAIPASVWKLEATLDSSPLQAAPAAKERSPVMGPAATAMDVQEEDEEEEMDTTPQNEDLIDSQRMQRGSGPPTPTSPPASPSDVQMTEAVPVFEFSFPSARSESMVEQYLRLQSSAAMSVEVPAFCTVTPPRLQAHQPANSQAAPSNAGVTQVTPQRSAAVDQVRRRVSQLATHNIAPFHTTDHPLTVLVSEAFLNDYCRSVDLGAHGIETLDAPLQEPVSLIPDATTAVCLVGPSRLTSKTELRCLVKALTEVTFKFSRIFLVVVLPAMPVTQDPAVRAAVDRALLTVCQATSRFPATVSIRQCSASGSNLTVLISQLCAQARHDALRANPAATEAKYAHRPFLAHLQQVDARYLAHCEFLQFFPTVNYFLAALLLCHHSVRELTGLRTRSLWDLVSTHYILTDELKDWLKSFVALLEVHAGLTMAAVCDGD